MLKKILIKNKVLIMSLAYLAVFEVVNYAFYDFANIRAYLGTNSFLYIIILNLVLFLLGYYFFSFKRLGKDLLKFLFPAILHVSVFLFLFTFRNFWINQIIILFSSVLYFFIFSKINNDDYKFRFVNIGSFFASFLFFFSMYFFIYNINISYLLVLFFVVIYSYLIMYYKIMNIEGGDSIKSFYNILFTILLVEIFFFSLFLPITSFFVKSIIMVLFYYFYWGLIDIYFRGGMDKLGIIKYFAIFMSLLSIIVIYFLAREGLAL